MSSSNVDLSGVRNLSSLLERLPQGTAARRIAAQLGVWTEAAHASDAVSRSRRTYPSSFSKLVDEQLSDEHAYWLGEFSRTTELVGLLEGQRQLMNLENKQTRAHARVKVRARLTESAKAEAAETKTKPKAVTAGQIADEVEEDRMVMDHDAALGMLLVVHESTKAYKEATVTVLSSISREISLRQAQMNARLR